MSTVMVVEPLVDWVMSTGRDWLIRGAGGPRRNSAPDDLLPDQVSPSQRYPETRTLLGLVVVSLGSALTSCSLTVRLVGLEPPPSLWIAVPIILLTSAVAKDGFCKTLSGFANTSARKESMGRSRINAVPRVKTWRMFNNRINGSAASVCTGNNITSYLPSMVEHFDILALLLSLDGCSQCCPAKAAMVEAVLDLEFSLFGPQPGRSRIEGIKVRMSRLRLYA